MARVWFLVWTRELSPRSDLEPIQPPILWVPRALSPAVKLITNLNLVLGSRRADLYICLHHTVLNNYTQGQLYVLYDGNRRLGLEGMLTVWKIYKYLWVELGISKNSCSYSINIPGIGIPYIEHIVNGNSMQSWITGYFLLYTKIFITEKIISEYNSVC
jgi:hypothetical protein